VNSRENRDKAESDLPCDG